MPTEEPFRFTDVAKLSVVDVRAPACPVGAQATLAEIVAATASVVLFAALFVGAPARNAASLLGAGLSLIALAVTSGAFVGATKSRFDGRG